MNETILGYKKDGTPITPTKPGMIYTQAFITCSICNHAIRSMGGPSYGAICVKCYDDQIKRYDISYNHSGGYLEHEEEQEGEWVRFEDIEHLINENKRLKEENEILNLIRNSTQFN